MQLANFAFVKKSFAAVGVSVFLFDSAVFWIVVCVVDDDVNTVAPVDHYIKWPI